MISLSSIRARRALIFGVTGQDGSYLASSLLEKGYVVWGTSRVNSESTLDNLRRLNLIGRLNLLTVEPTDIESVQRAFSEAEPDEVYYLSGQSSVAISFQRPAETLQSNAIGLLNVLEAGRLSSRAVRIYNAGSSEIYGDTGKQEATESTPFNPCSPYGVAKLSAYWLVKHYRNAHQIYACTGILFNHESPLRPERFVTQKIIRAVKKISEGSMDRLTLGRTDIIRDWGWAPEYVEGMWAMLQLDEPVDLIIATGESHSLGEFISHAFAILGLDWQRYIVEDLSLSRPTDLIVSRANPSKALGILGWAPTVRMHRVIELMLKDL